MMNRNIRVVVVDDHLVVREGLRLILETVEDIELVGEANDGASALRIIRELQPDVVLMDLRMPGMDGIEAIEQLQKSMPHIFIVILTTFNEDDLMLRGLQAGARSFLLKDTTRQTLLEHIRAAARGETLLQPQTLARLLARTITPVVSVTTPTTSLPATGLRLTEREQEVLRAVARGERSKEIAAHLGVTERTVKAHLANVFAKLEVDSRAAAVAVAIERKLLNSGFGQV